MNQQDQKKLIDNSFRKEFGAYLAPDVPLTETIAKMEKEERQLYYLKAKELVENPVLWDLLRDSERIVVRSIAELDSSENIKFSALKLMLFFVKDSLPNEIKMLASKYRAPSIQDDSIERLRKI